MQPIAKRAREPGSGIALIDCPGCTNVPGGMPVGRNLGSGAGTAFRSSMGSIVDVKKYSAFNIWKGRAEKFPILKSKGKLGLYCLSNQISSTPRGFAGSIAFSKTTAHAISCPVAVADATYVQGDGARHPNPS